MQSKYGFRLTPLALQDIDEALSYIAETLANGQAAEKLLSNIEKTINTVCEFPFSSADCKIFLVQDENIIHGEPSFGRGDGRTHDLLVPRRNKLRFEPFLQAERASALRCCSSSRKKCFAFFR